MEMEKIARYAYIAFLALAIIMGLVVGYMAWAAKDTGGFNDTNVSNIHGWMTLILLILGIIVGFVSITTTEVSPFLIATIALIVASISNVWNPLSTLHDLLYFWATGILSYIVAFAAPAAVLIAIRSILQMTKTK